MNKIVNKFLLAGDKIMSEMQLRQPVFMQRVYRPLLKTKKESKNLKKQEIQDIYPNMLWLFP